MNDESLAPDEAHKIRRAATIQDAAGTHTLTPLSQLDGGEWATLETNDTSRLRERLGLAERALPAEHHSLDQDDAVV